MLEPLQAIHDVTQACSRANIDHWLFGGWAIDFHLGVVTRHHDDIDFIIWSHDIARLTIVLQHQGFICTGTLPEHAYFEKYQQRVEISFIDRTTSGEIITPGRWAFWPWAHDAFLADDRVLLGVCCPVTSLDSVIASKRDFQAHAPHNPLRGKDWLDLARVQHYADKSNQ